jgi:HSP20 family molecular chaperone IbpA
MFIKIHPLLTKEPLFPTKRPEIIPRESTVAPSVELQHHHEVVNSENEFTVSIDVPGVKISDLSVTVDVEAINVSGVRRRRSSSGETIKKSSFSKSFPVDVRTVDLSKVKANLADGVLVITAPRKQKPEHRTIEITINPQIEPKKVETSNVSEMDESKDTESKSKEKSCKKSKH